MNFKVYHRIEDIGESIWDSYVSHRFFLSYNYLAALERGCPQISYRYVICFDGNQFLGICYFQVIPFSGENLRQYIPQQNPMIARGIRVILDRIQTQLLVLGNVIFTCENGVLISEHAFSLSEKIVDGALEEAKKSLGKIPLGTMISENISDISTHIFCANRFHEFQVEDRMELNLSEFHTFNDYKLKLISKYRVRMNKLYSLNKDTVEIDITDENFALYRERIEELFYQVLDKSKFKLVKLKANYFEEFLIKVRRFRMKGYLVQNQLIGFISYFQLNEIIEVHYVGMDYQYNHSHKIYNFILYKMIEIAFQYEKKRICYGRTAQELKSTLGAKPYSLMSSLKVNQGVLNIFTPYFLNRLVPEPWVLRNPFKENN